MPTPIHKPWRAFSEKLRKRDARLAPLIAQVGPPRFELQPDPFRALVRAILSQQLAVAAAATITKRFCALSPPFPSAKKILQLTTEELRAVGVSGQKASYLKSLSQRWQDRAWKKGWSDLSDEELVARLIEVKGVGEWTAHMFLIFSLGRPDVLPVGDYGVRKGIQLLYGLEEMPSSKDLPELVPQWKGMASVGAWYMWRGLDLKLIRA